eukprot:Sspe_Gene.21407::Locus_8020_Transcript_1_1_Confidence_1.000_Length_1537::g.21407::m.21407
MEGTERDALPAPRRFVALTVPRVALEEAWRVLLEQQLEHCGNIVQIECFNRRCTSGNLHHASILFDTPKAARVALSTGLEIGGRQLTAALSRGGPGTVHLENLDLPPDALLKQFSTIGPIVASRILSRQLKAALVFADRRHAKEATELSGKPFQGHTVNITLESKKRAAEGSVKVIKRPKVGPDRKQLFLTMPDDVRRAVAKLRKNKETVMSNLKVVRTHLKKTDKEADPEKHAVLVAEEERLVAKNKKLHKHLSERVKPYVKALKSDDAVGDEM